MSKSEENKAETVAPRKYKGKAPSPTSLVQASVVDLEKGENGDLFSTYVVEKPVRYSGLLVSQSNTLIQTKMKLSVDAAKVLRACFSLINSRFNYNPIVVENDVVVMDHGSFELDIRMTTQELCNLLRVRAYRLRDKLHGIAEEIGNLKLLISENDSKSFRLINLTSEQFFNAEEDEFRIVLNSKMNVYLTGLISDYTSYPLEAILKIKTAEGIDFFERITMVNNKSKNKRATSVRVSVKEIYIIFNVIDRLSSIPEDLPNRSSYIASLCPYEDDPEYYYTEGIPAQFGQFHRNRLKKLIEKIESQTDSTIEFELERKKRKVTHINFKVKSNSTLVAQVTDFRTKSIEELVSNLRWDMPSYNECAHIFGAEAILNAVRHVLSKDRVIGNVGNYIRAILRNRSAELPAFLDSTMPFYADKQGIRCLIEEYFRKAWFTLKPENRALLRTVFSGMKENEYAEAIKNMVGSNERLLSLANESVSKKVAEIKGEVLSSVSDSSFLALITKAIPDLYGLLDDFYAISSEDDIQSFEILVDQEAQRDSAFARALDILKQS